MSSKLCPTDRENQADQTLVFQAGPVEMNVEMNIASAMIQVKFRYCPGFSPRLWKNWFLSNEDNNKHYQMNVAVGCGCCAFMSLPMKA